MRERGRLSEQIDGVKRLERDVEDALGLIELAEAEGDADTANAATADLQRLAVEAKKREIESASEIIKGLGRPKMENQKWQTLF